MLAKLEKILEKQCQLEKTRPLLVGFSGGPDSYCLLDTLARLDYTIVVAHLDHGLRPDSSQEAETVRKIAKEMNLPAVINADNVSAFAAAHSMSLEEAARECRYQFLFQEAERLKVGAIAVGHTADDQVETVLMHFIRGTGRTGLIGMAPRTIFPTWSETIPVVRPLLSIWRDEVLRYCQERNLRPVFDHSNLDRTFLRNRLRYELIPHLAGYNPQIKDAIWRMANILAGETPIIEKALAHAWDLTVLDQGQGYVQFNGKALASLESGLSRGLLRRAILWLRPSLRDISFQVVSRSERFLTDLSTTGPIDLVAGLRLQWEGEDLWMFSQEIELPTTAWPQIDQEGSIWMDVPGKVDLSGDWLLVADQVRITEQEKWLAEKNRDPFSAWIDGGGVEMPLRVNRRKPGDRFAPLGLAGHTQKVSDFLINERLPKRARVNYPMIRVGDQIVWIPGFRIAHNYRITDQTEVGIYLRCVRKSEAG